LLPHSTKLKPHFPVYVAGLVGTYCHRKYVIFIFSATVVNIKNYRKIDENNFKIITLTPGADVMIKLSCNFCQFSAKNGVFSQKPML
jgi:hypothetical protein